MVSQYPHTITIQLQGEFEQDASGNFQPKAGTGGTFSSECRAEPAGTNPVIKGADGEDIVFVWVVYMPKSVVNFQFGDDVTVTINGENFSGTVKRQYNGQFNTRLWV